MTRRSSAAIRRGRSKTYARDRPGPSPASASAGWTAPKTVHGVPAEGTWRCHLTPLERPRTDPGQLAQLETWLRSYRPEELFDETGVPVPEIRALARRGTARMSASLHANGGTLARDLLLPDIERWAGQG